MSTMGNKDVLKITSHTVNVVVNGPGSKKSQPLRLMADTGSTDLVLYTNGCSGCWTEQDHVKGYKAGTDTTQPYSTSYGAAGNSAVVTGHREMAVVKLGKFSSQESVAAISSISSQTIGAQGNSLSGRQGGIIGLGLHPPNQPAPFWRKHFSTFGLGFNKRKSLNGRLLQGNGTLALGSYDKTIVKDPDAISWHPLALQSRWSVNLESSGPAGPFAPPNFGAGVALVDSGSNLITGPPQIVRAIYRHLKTMNLIPSFRLDLTRGTYQIPCGEKGRFEFTLNGELYAIRWEDFEVRSGGTCYGALIAGGTPPGVDWILGGPFLRTVYTIFDADNQRIGFYPTL